MIRSLIAAVRRNLNPKPGDFAPIVTQEEIDAKRREFSSQVEAVLTDLIERQRKEQERILAKALMDAKAEEPTVPEYYAHMPIEMSFNEGWVAKHKLWDVRTKPFNHPEEALIALWRYVVHHGDEMFELAQAAEKLREAGDEGEPEEGKEAEAGNEGVE